MRSQRVSLIVLEPAGDLEGAVARVMGCRAKTGRMDVRTFAHLAQIIDRHERRSTFVRTMLSEQQTELAAEVARRRLIVAMLVVENNRLPQAHIKVQKSNSAVRNALSKVLLRVQINLTAQPAL